MDRLELRLLDGNALGVMTVLENQDRWETSNVDVTSGRVTTYEKSPSPGTHRFLDYGMLALRAQPFEQISATTFDLGMVIQNLVATEQLLAMTVTRRFFDIGNETSVRATEHHLREHRSP